MEKAMKAGLAVFACMALCGTALAGPGHHGPGRGPGGPGRPGGHGFGRGPAPMMHHRPPAFHHPPAYHHHHSHWGRGGRNFWPGFVGGVVGGLVYDAVAPAPVIVTPPTVVTTPVVTTPVVTTPVVTTPVATTQSVWVNGCYVDQVQANGVVVRVWQPGHYEQRAVYVQ